MKKSIFNKREDSEVAVYQAMGSLNENEAKAATQQFAQALELPLRQAIFDCDNVGPFGIFEPMDFRNARCVEFPLDPIQPGSENDFTAYAIPDCAQLPCVMLEGDYVTVPTYMLGNCVEWCLKRVRDANFNILDRAAEAFRAGFTKKMNDDAWHVILGAALDRNVIVYDSNAATGQFTKRLVTLAKTVMRRNGGGNSTCLNRARLTDLFMSPEAMDDIFNWNVDQIDEITRREIYTNGQSDCDRGLTNLFCVNFHILDELGAGQEYQLYYENELGGTMPAGDQELVIGLDLSRRDSFVAPVREELQVFDDITAHKQMKGGIYGWWEGGFSVLSSLRVLALSI